MVQAARKAAFLAIYVAYITLIRPGQTGRVSTSILGRAYAECSDAKGSDARRLIGVGITSADVVSSILLVRDSHIIIVSEGGPSKVGYCKGKSWELNPSSWPS